MSTQTFANGEVGLSIRNKINSVFHWNPSYSYGIDDVCHISGTMYSSLVNNNTGSSPISSAYWQPTGTSVSSSLSISSSYSLLATSASWAPSLQSTLSISSSFASSSISSSYSLTANSSLSSISSTRAISSSFASGSTSSSYSSTSNIALNSINSTRSISSSYASSSVSSSYSLIANTAVNLVNSTYNISVLQSSQSRWATSSSFASSSVSSSYAVFAQTYQSVTFLSSSTSASYAFQATSASWSPSSTLSTSASFASSSISSSYAPVEPKYSASVSIVKQDTLVSDVIYPTTSSWAGTSFVAISSSLAENAVNASTSDFSTLSNTATTASFAKTSSYFSGSITFGPGVYDLTSSVALTASSGPFVKLSGDTMTGALTLINGSKSTTSLNFGTSNTGLYSAAGGLGWSIGGTVFLRAQDSNSGLQLHSAWPLSWGSGVADSANDTFLYREAANTLALRNTGSAQTLRIYNTYTDASNYSRLALYSSGIFYYIEPQMMGTSGANNIWIKASSGGRVYLSANAYGAGQWYLDTTGNLYAGADNTYDIGANGANRPRVIYGVIIYASDYLNTGQGGVRWAASGTRIVDSGDGILKLRNNADNSFDRLQFGGTTSSYPAIKRYSGSLNFRLADDSADCAITASTVICSSSLAYYTSSAAPTNTGSIRQWTDVVVNGITYKMPLYL